MTTYIAVGAKVVLKSGGPTMTVLATDLSGKDPNVWVCWFDKENVYHTQNLPGVAVNLVTK